MDMTAVQYYPDDDGVEHIKKAYSKHAPHARAIGDTEFSKRVCAAIRNARAHAAAYARVALTKTLPHDRNEDGKIVVCLRVALLFSTSSALTLPLHADPQCPGLLRIQGVPRRSR